MEKQGIERIKILASDIKDKPLLKIIEYLLSREDMNEKYLNEEKSLSQMVNFIRNEARKESTDGMAWIEDEVVYGWAIHYFDESNEKLGLNNKQIIENPKNNEVTEKLKEINVELSKKEPQKNSIKQKWVAEGQLSLFD